MEGIKEKILIEWIAGGRGSREEKNSEFIPGFWFGDGVAGRAFYHKEE